MKKNIILIVIFAILICSFSYFYIEKTKPYEIVKVWGKKGTGDGQFRYIEDFAFDAKGNLLVTDALNSTVSVFSTNGVFITKFAGKGKGNKYMEKPEGIAVAKDGAIFVADYLSGYIKKFSAQYQHVMTFSGFGQQPSETSESEFMDICSNGH